MTALRPLLLLLLLAPLSACDRAEDNATRLRDNTLSTYDEVRYEISDWFYRRDGEEKPQRPLIPPSYCYQLSSDIVCYSAPQAKLKRRLLGVQGDGTIPRDALIRDGETGETYANYSAYEAELSAGMIAERPIGAPFDDATEETLRRAGLERARQPGSSGASGRSITRADSGAPRPLIQTAR